jgi:hypothetical protein
MSLFSCLKETDRAVGLLGTIMAVAEDDGEKEVESVDMAIAGSDGMGK